MKMMVLFAALMLLGGVAMWRSATKINPVAGAGAPGSIMMLIAIIMWITSVWLLGFACGMAASSQ